MWYCFGGLAYRGACLKWCVGRGQDSISSRLDFAWFLLFFCYCIAWLRPFHCYRSLAYRSACLGWCVGWGQIFIFTWLDFAWFCLFYCRGIVLIVLDFACFIAIVVLVFDCCRSAWLVSCVGPGQILVSSLLDLSWFLLFYCNGIAWFVLFYSYGIALCGPFYCFFIAIVSLIFLS
jgi:hypothetical protein